MLWLSKIKALFNEFVTLTKEEDLDEKELQKTIFSEETLTPRLENLEETIERGKRRRSVRQKANKKAKKKVSD